jgi:hypothetical protein
MRFRTIALIGMTSERKVTSSRTNASVSTNANTSGARAAMSAFQSFDCAAMPDT